MRRNTLIGLLALTMTVPALADDKAATPPAGMPDMSKMGPGSRIPKNEKADKKELAAFYKAMEEAGKKGDAEALAALVDFPVTMQTDDHAGKFSQIELNHDQWVAEMKPFMDSMKGMKDYKETHSGTCYVLSDDLASCEGVVNTQMGKTKMKFIDQSILIRKDGKWLVKSMLEAGWGDAPPPGSPDAAPAAAPAPAPAPAK